MCAQKSLNGMRVLVTRPAPKGQILCGQLRAHGGRPIYFPTIEIFPPNDLPLFEKQISELQQYDWIIFTSPQAVYQIKSLPSEPTKIAAIGAGTALALREAKLPVHLYPQEEFNSEALLDFSELQNVKDKKIAIIKGEGGRELLSETLTARGAMVTEINSYRRALPVVNVDEYLDLLRRNAVDVIICTSNDGLQNLKILLEASWSNLQKIPMLVISERMQTRATELGFEKILLAKNPSFEAILEVLEGMGMTNNTDRVENGSSQKHSSAATFSVVLSLLAVLGVIGSAVWMHMNFSKNSTQNSGEQTSVLQLQKNVDVMSKQVSQLSDDLKSQTEIVNAMRQTQSGYNRNEWRVLEAEFLVKTANSKLQLENNIQQAIVLLQYADQEIRDLNDANLLPLRKALADDIARLQTVPQLDVSGLYLKLSAVNDAIGKLTLPNKPIQDAQAPVVNSNLSWWKRGLQETWQALRQVVTVHYYDKTAPALVMPDQQDFLFQNIHADLEKAMWALMHQQPVIYRASLDQASTWIKQYFMSATAPVQSVLTSLAQLQAIDIYPAMPKISESLQAFQEYFVAHNMQDTNQPAAAKQ